MKSRHSRRIVPISRSQNALACGARVGVLRTVSPIAAMVRSTASEYQPGQRDERQPRRAVGPPRLDLPLEVQRKMLAQEQILGGELRGWTKNERRESQDVGGDARDRAEEAAGTGLGHAAGSYAREARSGGSSFTSKGGRMGSRPP